MISITRDVLRTLNAAAGKLDTDSGKVFAGFVGRFHMTDRLFHGEVRFTDPGGDPPSDTTSVKAILSPSSSAKTSSQAKPKKSAKPGAITDKGK